MKRIVGTLLAVVATAALAALPGTTSRNDFTGNGSTTAFTFTFKATTATWVAVYLGGVKQTSGYVVTLNANQTTSPGGTVTFTPAPASGATVRIQREVPLTQDSVWTPYSAFRATTLENQLDRLVMQDQQIQRELDDGVSLTGPQGLQGATGPQGSTGATGATGATGTPGTGSAVRATSLVTATSTTPVNITGLSWSVTSATATTFMCWIHVQSNGTGYAPQVLASYPGSGIVDAYVAYRRGGGGTTIYEDALPTSQGAYWPASGGTSWAGAGATGLITVYGWFTPSASGTLQWQLRASGAGTVYAYQRSTCLVY